MKTIFILIIYFHSCVSQNYFQPYNTKINPNIEKNTDTYNVRNNNLYIDKITDPHNDRKNNPYNNGKIDPYVERENNLPSCKTVRSSWISFYDTNLSQDCVFPFVYKDEIYDGCVSMEDNTNLGKAVKGPGTM